MEAYSFSRENRISPRKARLVADEIKGIGLPEAMDILRSMPQKAARMLFKTLHSAGANAKYKNPEINEDSLYVKKITVDEGRRLKRFRARARGRAGRIRKRTASILIVLSDEN